MKSPTAQKWILTAEMAAVKPARLTLQIKDQQIDVKTPATGAITNWRGSLFLSAKAGSSSSPAKRDGRADPTSAKSG